MGREISRDIVVGNLETGKVRLRTAPKIENELVAVSELDQPRRVGLRASKKWTSGAERDDRYFVFSQWLGIGKVVIAVLRHMYSG